MQKSIYDFISGLINDRRFPVKDQDIWALYAALGVVVIKRQHAEQGMDYPSVEDDLKRVFARGNFSADLKRDITDLAYTEDDTSPYRHRLAAE